MADFDKFNQAMQHQFNKMKKLKLFRVSLSKDELWTTYLAAFPPGSNPRYKERTEHDCQCCRSFIRNVGDLVAIDSDGKLITLWDVDVKDEAYQVVADAMTSFVKRHSIEDVFLHTEPTVGVGKNFGTNKETGVVTAYYHFQVQLPKEIVCKPADVGPRLSILRANKEVFFRSLTELTDEACDTVLELISQNSLYRGEEHKYAVSEFRKLKTQFNKLKTPREKDIFCWSRLDVSASILKIRNTAIGTLLVDLSEGKELEQAVTAFERVVAPTNYKRPTAVVTKTMVENAKKKINELGLSDSLERRYATLQDISVNNIVFVDRSVKKDLKGDVFDEISSKVSDSSKKLDKVEEISIEKFISDVVPKATSIEVMFENRHKNNLVSLIAPANMTAKGMFKWSNPFSWSYRGDLTDSIKERVKAAGGKVDADWRASLSWFNHDDLDLHLVQPNGSAICFRRKQDLVTCGELDVDMNAGSGTSRTPVENIVFADRKQMLEGRYQLKVHNFRKRETEDVGFLAEIEFDGQTTTFSYAKAVAHDQTVVVAEFDFSRKDGIKWINTLPSDQRAETVWNVTTQSFHKVNLLMLSPNHWDGQGIGNKHYFFFLDKCVNDGTSRGFFNEFLSQELDQHRKVLEIVGSKMKAEESPDQLSGLGFSSTVRGSIICRVTGSFTRTVKVLF